MPDHDAAELARDFYSIEAEVQGLPGYTDSNYRLTTADAVYTLRLSPPDSKTAEFDLQALVLRRLGIAQFDAPTPVRTTEGADWVQLNGGWFARLFTWVEGRSFSEYGRPPRVARSIGQTAGQIAVLLEDLDHPAASRYSEWNIMEAAALIEDHATIVALEGRRRIVASIAKRLRSLELTELPLQVIHNDLNDDNVLIDGRRVVGVIDVGDAMRTARIAEPAIAAAYSMLGQDDPITVATEVLAGYNELVDVSEKEARVVLDLIQARLATSVVQSARRGGGNPHHVKSEAEAWDLLERLDSADHDCLQAELAAAVGHRHTNPQRDLEGGRRRVLGPSLSLNYSEPINMVRGFGQYLYDERGRRYLDAVNNVAHVGHANPSVVAAISRQAAVLNTNTRYLHEGIIEYAGRLSATLPDGLDVVYLVNSGSEANELAIRMARSRTGAHDIASLEHGYHGNTTTLIEVSHYKSVGPGGSGQPTWVVTLPIPDPYRHPEFSEPAVYRTTVDELFARRTSPIAALITESIPGVAGQIMPAPGVVGELYESARTRGAVVIADEVQAGMGRVGETFWSFQLHDVTPDIVTVGKPIGNGHPLGAVVTTRAVADAFDNGMEYFNTFGGNPVSVAAGGAVLEVIESEGLQEHARSVGASLKNDLRDLMGCHKSIGDIRGAGLFLGVELVEDRASKAPADALATSVIESAKTNGVLLGTDGPLHNVLKIKPPLVFTNENAAELVEVIDHGLAKI